MIKLKALLKRALAMEINALVWTAEIRSIKDRAET